MCRAKSEKVGPARKHCVGSHRDLPREVIVIKSSMYAKCGVSWRVENTSDLSNTLDSQIFTVLIGRRNQDFKANLGPHRWTVASENQRPIECNVIGEAALHVLGSVIPVKKDGQFELVPNRASAPRSESDDSAERHT
jgi:hypothetical protein